jgi:hypothetical protein
MARGKVTEVDWPNGRRCSRACGRRDLRDGTQGWVEVGWGR